MIELSEKTVVEARPDGKYGPYLALGRKMPGAWVRWVLLSRSVVQLRLCTDINQRVKQRTEEKFHLHTNQYVLVSNYRGHTYVGYHRLDENGQVIPDKGINLNVDEWIAFKKHFPTLRAALKTPTQPLGMFKTTWVFF